jgi:hypothetical protein
MSRYTRRQTLAGAAAALAAPSFASAGRPAMPTLVLTNAKVTTLDRENPQAQAVAIRDGVPGGGQSEQEVRAAAAPGRHRDRRQGPSPDPRLDRQPHPRHPRRPEL